MKKKNTDITNSWNTEKAQQVIKNQIKSARERSIQEQKDYEESLVSMGQIQGIAYMTAELSRYCSPEGNVIAAWKAWGLTVEECRRNNVEEHDQEILDKYEKHLDGN